MIIALAVPRLQEENWNMRRGPGFFIIGAPKCGTTALQTYLAKNPAIYMPDLKECHYFATDLISANDYFRSAGRYTELFAEATDEKVVGEASVLYLYSKVAASNIYQFNPEAKIIVMFRDPIEAIQAYHAQLVYAGHEPFQDLAAALSAEQKRKQNGCGSGGSRFRGLLFYEDVMRWAEQLERYLLLFRRSHLHVILYEEFKENTAQVYRDTVRFLGVPDDGQTEFVPVNMSKRARCTALNRFFYRSPLGLRLKVQQLLPEPARHWVTQVIKQLLTKYERRKLINAGLQADLRAKYAPEVQRLSQLLNCSLEQWRQLPAE